MEDAAKRDLLMTSFRQTRQDEVRKGNSRHCAARHLRDSSCLHTSHVRDPVLVLLSGLVVEDTAQVR